MYEQVITYRPSVKPIPKWKMETYRRKEFQFGDGRKLDCKWIQFIISTQDIGAQFSILWKWIWSMDNTRTRRQISLVP